jgi:hypothetical protein
LAPVKNGPDALETGFLFYTPRADIGQATLPIAMASSVTVEQSSTTSSLSRAMLKALEVHLGAETLRCVVS